MTDLHELLLKRRSIRRYTAQPIAPEQVQLLLEAALLAPTSKSSRSWQFVVIDNPELLERLAQCKEHGAGPIARCPLAVAVVGDPSKTDPWVEDCSIAAAYMQLQAADLGLGSCWVQVRGRFAADGTPSEEVVGHLLGLPEELPTLCIVTFGHPDEERRPADPAKLLWENVHIGNWNVSGQ